MVYADILGWLAGLTLPVALRGGPSLRRTFAATGLHLALIGFAALMQMWVLLILSAGAAPVLALRLRHQRRHAAQWARFAAQRVRAVS